MWTIRQETGADLGAVDSLVAECFGPGRYAKSAYRLRDGVHPEPGLSFVAIEDGVLRGSVRFWPVFAGAEPALLLGPLAVDGAQRGRGIGIALMNEGIEKARELGHGAVILVGDLPYYSRVGFGPMTPGRIEFPGPVDARRLLGLALQPGALERLAGSLRRARADDGVAADGVPWGAAV
ncbi:MAG: N-acetyltransferase [Rhizomicrobium sp.]|jgi:predicted N-acetyltransferase YhbS